MSTNLPGHCFIHISCHLQYCKVESLTRIPDFSTVNLLYLLYDAYSKSSTSPQTHESGGEDYGIKVVAVTPVAVKFLMLVVLLLLLLLSGLHPPPTHLTVNLCSLETGPRIRNWAHWWQEWNEFFQILTTMYHAGAIKNVPQLGVKGLGFYIVKALQLGLITWTVTDWIRIRAYLKAF